MGGMEPPGHEVGGPASPGLAGREGGMPDMRLYYSPGSSSLASHIALIEAALPFEAVRVDEHTKAMEGGGDYRQVHWLGYVPALLLDDGTLLTEGAAILQHVAELAPERNLVPPAGTVERARLQAWLNFLSSEVHKSGFSPLFNPAMPETAKRLFRDRLALRLTHLDRHLVAREHLLASGYSVADAACFVVTSWANWVDVDLTPYPSLRAHRERIGTRRAVQAALAAEGMVPWPDKAP
jgi:glutathione S-transferase